MARKTPLDVTAPRTPQDLGAAFFMFLLFFSLFAIVGYGYTVMLQQITDMSQSLDDRQQQEALLAGVAEKLVAAPGYAECWRDDGSTEPLVGAMAASISLPGTAVFLTDDRREGLRLCLSGVLENLEVAGLPEMVVIPVKLPPPSP